MRVSIHAPARGATQVFYSNKHHDEVSIHAPARGATASLNLNKFGIKGFNPRSRAGRDGGTMVSCREYTLFQSTLPRGERRYMTVEEEAATLFQSTLPRGERLRLFNYSPAAIRVSIHAPARGATYARREAGNTRPGFNPRSRAGSDRGSFGPWQRIMCFNPRSRAGSDFRFQTNQLPSSCFNPRSRAGSDPPGCPQSAARQEFQSTLPRGERPITV